MTVPGIQQVLLSSRSLSLHRDRAGPGPWLCLLPRCVTLSTWPPELQTSALLTVSRGYGKLQRAQPSTHLACSSFPSPFPGRDPEPYWKPVPGSPLRQAVALATLCSPLTAFCQVLIYLTVLLSNSPAIKGLFTNLTISLLGTTNKQQPN